MDKFKIKKYTGPIKKMGIIDLYGSFEEKPEIEKELFQAQSDFFRTKKISDFYKIQSSCVKYTESLLKKRYHNKRIFEDAAEITIKANMIANIFCRQYLTFDFYVQGSFAGYMSPKVLEITCDKNLFQNNLALSIELKNGESYSFLDTAEYSHYDTYESVCDTFKGEIKEILMGLYKSDCDEYITYYSIRYINLLILSRLKTHSSREFFKDTVCRDLKDRDILNLVETNLYTRVQSLYSE